MKELEFQEEWLSAYLDDELTEEQRQVVEQRLAVDPAAHIMLDDVRRVRAMVAKLPSWAGAEFKFTIPSELPDAFSDESPDADDELADDELADGSDFEEVPRSLAGTDSSASVNEVSRGAASSWREDSRGSQRSMLAWLATAASVLLMAGLGYFLWPSGGLMVSQLDQSVETAAPASRFKKELAPRRAGSIQPGAAVDSLTMNDNVQLGESRGSSPATAMSPSELMPPSVQLSLPDVALMAPRQFEREDINAKTRAEAAEGVAGRDAKSLLDASRNLSGAPALAAPTASSSSTMQLRGNATAELQSLAAPQAKGKADQNAEPAEPELLSKQAAEDLMLRQQTQGAASLGMEKAAPVVIVARSSRWNEAETLQFAASQAATFYGENALNYRQNAPNVQNPQPAAKDYQSSDEGRSAGRNADVLMATVKSDPATTESLFNSVVTTNQFLPVEPLQVATATQLANRIVAPVADSPAGFAANSPAVPTDAAKSQTMDVRSSEDRNAGSNAASSNTENNRYFQTQLGRSGQNALQGNSLVLFVTREEANRILKELQQQGQVSSQVWRVVQRSIGQAEDSLDSQTRNSSETKSLANEAAPNAALNRLNEQNKRFGDLPPPAIPPPADNDKVILMLNALPQ